MAAGRPRGDTITIRTSLFRSLGLLILGLSLAILAITWWTARRAAETASAQLIEATLERTQAELRGFFEPVTRNLRVARAWIESGLVAPGDTASLNRLFQPLLEAHPQLSAAHWGDADGRGWMLLQLPDRWRNRRVDPPRLGASQRFREWPREGGEARTWTVEDPAPGERYDPRARAWYRTAVEAAGEDARRGELPPTVYWTEPYSFFTTGEPGITAATLVRTPDGRRLVLALDLLLRDVTAFTQTLSVSPRGFVGILSSDRRILALPRHPDLEDADARAEALLRYPEDLGIPVLRDAVLARERAGRAAGEAVPGTAAAFEHRPPLRFESGGETWWAGSHVVEVPPGRVFAVVVAVPEADLLGPVRRLPAGVALAAALALGAAIWMALRLAARYGQPLSRLAANSERIRHLDLAPPEPVRTHYAEVSQLARSQESMRSALDSFSRYVPTDVVRELLDRGDAARIGGTRETLTILFTDVEGFTRISERMSPEEITEHMADYFEQMLGIIGRSGTVDKLVGDGIMAFWGAPRPDPHHARHAVEAALACQAHLARQNELWAAQGRPPLPTRFGLACGPALVGNVGSPQRLSYTAVGDAVNLSSRLEGLNRLYGTRVLAADPVPTLAGAAFAWREVDRVRVVGRSQAVDVHELLGRRDAVAAESVAFGSRYAEALALFRARSFQDARAVLDGLAPPRRRDASVRRLRQACVRFAKTPPPDEWEGVTVLETK